MAHRRQQQACFFGFSNILYIEMGFFSLPTRDKDGSSSEFVIIDISDSEEAFSSLWSGFGDLRKQGVMRGFVRIMYVSMEARDFNCRLV
jgi:hypothetical protein